MSSDPIADLYRVVRRRKQASHRLADKAVFGKLNSAHRSPESTAYIMVSGKINSAHRSLYNLVSHAANSAHRLRRHRVTIAGTHARAGRELVAWTRRGLQRQLAARFAAAERMSLNPCGYGLL